ncbi:MAG TPA: succinate dehydrogenase/fumarate reductase iron-sulfur subunit [Perlabentimonas sp.]|nr:succinate dehydrogenase/fumarate reductase iron-sulfur subunit [Bacteroidales bacterium]MDD4673145.1 succinate dehydrogenase/fumarate reductase iron-sulfur subunit [Bacteroidales bacterium]MDY0348168.1 succinate dehydrogenase/fumarate reductase iron-sulfur subunit [Tenuifilaceae bacterium]HZJ73212.1 succinate dehydrogenase/fumarate reductase iron-sulfur subunit [Perlabentimonas sp.]
MNFKLKIWRQKNAKAKGKFETYALNDVSPEMSFLEMLDCLNNQLITSGKDPVAYEHDCREGICGCCGLYINGRPHGAKNKTTTCELYMREFTAGETITIEPWRAAAFPVIKDLIVERNAFDKIMQAGGFISVNTGQAQDANAIPVSKAKADEAFDAASCIGCGACVAACKNSSAMLFIAAKVSQLALYPQGRVEAKERVKNMVAKMDELGFGGCTNTRACEAECPKGISISHIARLNREFIAAKASD